MIESEILTMKGEKLVNKKVSMAIEEYHKKHGGGYNIIDNMCIIRIFYAYFSRRINKINSFEILNYFISNRFCEAENFIDEIAINRWIKQYFDADLLKSIVEPIDLIDR